MITRAIVLLCALLLCGCQKDTAGNAQNIITLADQQRHKVIKQTRVASYSIFPDTDDIKKLKDDTFLDAMHAETANGSAFAVRADGLVATNVHVIEGTNFCTGKENAQPMSPEDGERERGRQKEETLRQENKKSTFCLLVTQSFTKVFHAKVVRMDRENDIALLCIEHPDTPMPYLKLAPPESYDEGTEVLTIGSPLGNMNFMTPGIISNLDFVQQDKETGKKGARKIQFSAPILPGNSGGALVSTANGNVVGQVVAIVMTVMGPTQMSYANPTEYLRENILNTPPCKND